MNIRLLLLAVIGLAVLPSIAFAQSFGKVFSTPMEREYLDRLREEALRELSEQERLALLDAPPTLQEIMEIEPTLIHMGGTVRRADGNHTIWLNGIAVRRSDLPANAQLEFVGNLGVLRVRGSTQEYLVRPGQTLNADTGDIREDYELTEEELKEVNETVAAREAAARPVRASSDSQPEEEPEEEPDNQALIQNIVEGLQMLQKARDLQEGVQ